MWFELRGPPRSREHGDRFPPRVQIWANRSPAGSPVSNWTYSFGTFTPSPHEGGVSQNRGTHQSSMTIVICGNKPTIIGFPYFKKPPFTPSWHNNCEVFALACSVQLSSQSTLNQPWHNLFTNLDILSCSHSIVALSRNIISMIINIDDEQGTWLAPY